MIHKASRKLLKMTAASKGKNLMEFLDDLAIRESVAALGKKTVEQILENRHD